MKAKSWEEMPIKYKDFENSFNKVNQALKIGCFEEEKDTRKMILG